MDYKLCEAAIKGDIQSLVEIMQTDPHILDKFLAGFFQCKNPLHVATSNGQTQFVKLLLRLKPELAQALDSERWSALHLASAKGHDEIVKELIDISPEMCLVRDRDGNNPLHVAAIKGNVSVLEVLLEANPLAARVRVDHNETILHLCVKHNQLESLELLLRMIKSRPFINAKDNDGNTILHIASLGKRYEIGRFVLRNNKIDETEKNGSGHTAKDIMSLEGDGVDQRELDLEGDGADQRELDLTENLLIRLANALVARDRKAGEWINKAKDTLMVVASLMATMAFQAGMSPPGGVWQDDSNGHRVGEAVMAYNYAHLFPHFVRSNTAAFFASLSMIFLLLTNGILVPDSAGTMWTFVMLMCVAIISMAISYTISYVVVTPKKGMLSLRHGVVIATIWWCSINGLLVLGYMLRALASAVQKKRTRMRTSR